MGRSKSRRAGAQAVSVPSAGSVHLPPVPEGVSVGPLQERTALARELFKFAGAWTPPPSREEVGWGAWIAGARLIGAVLLETKATAGMIHGPVVVGREIPDPLEIAAHLLASLLREGTGRGIQTLFARPQGLDRVWVRFGFIPLPEATLPTAFRGRPGAGLFAWRGGSALWSSRQPPPDPDAGPPADIFTLPSPPSTAGES